MLVVQPGSGSLDNWDSSKRRIATITLVLSPQRPRGHKLHNKSGEWAERHIGWQLAPLPDVTHALFNDIKIPASGARTIARISQRSTQSRMWSKRESGAKGHALLVGGRRGSQAVKQRVEVARQLAARVHARLHSSAQAERRFVSKRQWVHSGSQTCSAMVSVMHALIVLRISAPVSDSRLQRDTNTTTSMT